MKMRQNSFYSQGEVCRTGRKFASYVLDFLVSVILMVLLFMACEGISNSTEGMKKRNEEVRSSYTSLINMIQDSGISKADESENLLSRSQLVENYMKGAVLHSLKSNGVTGISEETYKDVTEMDEKKDYAFYYYVTFKTSHISDYKEEAKTTVGADYYYQQLVQYSSDDHFVLTEDKYPIISLDSAKAIDNYFRDSSYSVGNSAYTSISESYSLLLQSGSKDLQNNYNPYLLLFEGYQTKLKAFYKIRCLELFLCYLLTLFIVYMMFPLIFRNGQTLSMKILKIGATDKNGNQVAWYQLLIKYAVHVLEFALIIPVVALLYYGTDALDLIGSSIVWNISYLSLGAFSIVFMVCSMILVFCLRKTKQSIPEYLSFMIVHDNDVMMVEETFDGENDNAGK